MLQAAAPHLQFPIAEPTTEELCAAWNAVASETKSPDGVRWKDIVVEFVRARNNPSNPDPSRAEIVQYLVLFTDRREAEEIADRLLNIKSMAKGG